jgi:hypothetical protein
MSRWLAAGFSGVMPELVSLLAPVAVVVVRR